MGWYYRYTVALGGLYAGPVACGVDDSRGSFGQCSLHFVVRKMATEQVVVSMTFGKIKNCCNKREPNLTRRLNQF